MGPLFRAGVIHQSRNTSASDDLLLAITDFGLTKAVLSDDDSRTRLPGGGADAFVTVDSADPLSP